MIKRKLNGPMDKSLADQEILKSDATVHNLWRPALSGTVPYGRQAIKQMKFRLALKFKSLL